MYENWPKRFANKVAIKGPDDCWLWLGVLIPGGYGQFWFEEKMRGAHVMALFFSDVEVPEGHVVMHSCDVRRCCNPRHLSAVKQRHNMKDMVSKGRSAKGEMHGSAILTADDVRTIRAKKETAASAAARYGVSRATINDIRQGLSWKHIT